MPGPVAARAREVDIIDTETRPGPGHWSEAGLSLGTGQCQSVPADSRHHTKCHRGSIICNNEFESVEAVRLKMMGADSAGRRLLFPRALPSIPVINGGKDHERQKRKIAVKCLELEEMLERQGWVSSSHEIGLFCTAANMYELSGEERNKMAEQ